MVDAAAFLEMACADGFQYPQYTYRIDVRSELGGIETDLYVALGGEIVYLVGFNPADHLHYAHRVAEIGIVKVKSGFPFEVCYPFAEIHRTAADDSVDFIPLF